MRHYSSNPISGSVLRQKKDERKEKRVLDLHLLLNRLDQDQEVAHELLLLFLCELDEVMRALGPERLRFDSPEKLMLAAHKLKGMCRDIGAEPLATLAMQIEINARKGALKEPVALAQALAAEHAQLCAVIHSWLEIQAS